MNIAQCTWTCLLCNFLTKHVLMSYDETIILGCQWCSELLINDKHETELNNRM